MFANVHTSVCYHCEASICSLLALVTIRSAEAIFLNGWLSVNYKNKESGEFHSGEIASRWAK